MPERDPFSQLGREWEAKRAALNQAAREDLARATKLKKEARIRRQRHDAMPPPEETLFLKRPDSAERKRRRREDYKNALEAQIKEKPSHHGVLRYRPAIGPNGATTACFGSRRTGEITTPPERQSRSKICNALEDRVSPSFPIGRVSPTKSTKQRTMTPLPDLIPSEEKVTVPPQQQLSADLRDAIRKEPGGGPSTVVSKTRLDGPPAGPPQFVQQPPFYDKSNITGFGMGPNMYFPYMMPPMYGGLQPPPPPAPRRDVDNGALRSTINRAVDEMQINTDRLMNQTRSFAPTFNPSLNTPIINPPMRPTEIQLPSIPVKSPRVKIEQLVTPRQASSRLDENSKQRKENYAAELREQMAAREASKKSERDKWAKMDAKLARECADYDPWGKAGAGAPLKGPDGKPISDLRRMKARNDQVELEAEISIDVEGTPRTENLAPLEEVRNEMLRHGVTKITDIYEPKKKVDSSYRAYLEEEIEKKEKAKREQAEQMKKQDELEEQRIRNEQLKLKREVEREKQREMEKIADAKEQNQALIEKKKVAAELGTQQNTETHKVKRHKVIELDPSDWNQKQAELDAKIREAQVAMTARSETKSVAENKQQKQLRETGHEPIARTPARTDVRGGKRKQNPMKLDLSGINNETDIESNYATGIKFNTLNDLPNKRSLTDKSPELTKLDYKHYPKWHNSVAPRPPSRTSLIDWGDSKEERHSPKIHHREPPVFHRGNSIVSAKLDELRRRLEHQSLRLQYRVDTGEVKPSSPPRFQIHRSANATTEMSSKIVQKNISTLAMGIQETPETVNSETQTPKPTKSRTVTTEPTLVTAGNHSRPVMVQESITGPGVKPKVANRSTLAKTTFNSVSTGTYNVEDDDAQIVVDDYVGAAENGPRDLSPDALMQIPNDDIDIFNDKLKTETNIVPAVDVANQSRTPSANKSSTVSLPGDATDNDTSPIKDFVPPTSPRKNKKSKIPRPAASSGQTSSASDFDFMRSFRQRNKERLYKLKALHDEYPSSRQLDTRRESLLSRRERRKPGTSSRLMPAKATRPATVLLPKL